MELSALIAQLDEVKFARLIRHFQEVRPPDFESDHFAIPAEPIAVSEAQILLRVVGKMSAEETYLGSWAFQMAHLPHGLGQSRQILDVLLAQLRRGLKQLAALPDPLRTLAGGDCDHPFRQHLGLGEGCDYHLVINIPLVDHTSIVEKFGKRSVLMFDKILNGPAKIPRFGLGTADTFAANCPDDTTRYLFELLSSPSGYQFFAREGQIAITPYTEHGLFIARGSGSLPATRRAMVTASSTVPKNEVDAPLIDELEQLINDPKVKEADIQNLFEERPALLRLINPAYAEFRPQLALSDSGGNRLVPDFLARIEGSDIWDLIELKLPRHSLLAGAGGKARASASAVRGISQLIQYRDFFSVQDNRALVSRRYGISPFEPNLILVTGRTSPGIAEWRPNLMGLTGATIVGYDFILDQARRRAMFAQEAQRDAASPK